MIVNKIRNISQYENIPAESVDFIRKLTPDIKEGRYVLSDKVYVNVESYMTKPLKDCRFELHKDYIDIQLLLKGQEKIYYADTKKLHISEPYRKDKDIAFFSDDLGGNEFVILDGTNFVLLMPEEAHAPQAAIGFGEKVLKVVVKIRKN